MDQLTINAQVIEWLEDLQERVEDLEMLEARIALVEHRCDWFEGTIAKIVRIAELETAHMKEVQTQISGIKLGLRELDSRVKNMRPE
jgi:uncharacterized protein Yka (UPF0111/DUF47 family)